MSELDNAIREYQKAKLNFGDWSAEVERLNGSLSRAIEQHRIAKVSCYEAHNTLILALEENEEI